MNVLKFYMNNFQVEQKKLITMKIVETRNPDCIGSSSQEILYQLQYQIHQEIYVQITHTRVKRYFRRLKPIFPILQYKVQIALNHP